MQHADARKDRARRQASFGPPGGGAVLAQMWAVPCRMRSRMRTRRIASNRQRLPAPTATTQERPMVSSGRAHVQAPDKPSGAPPGRSVGHCAGHACTRTHMLARARTDARTHRRAHRRAHTLARTRSHVRAHARMHDGPLSAARCTLRVAERPWRTGRRSTPPRRDSAAAGTALPPRCK